jgi:hypothetical protein
LPTTHRTLIVAAPRVVLLRVQWRPACSSNAAWPPARAPPLLAPLCGVARARAASATRAMAGRAALVLALALAAPPASRGAGGAPCTFFFKRARV